MKNATFILINPNLAGFSFNGYLDQEGNSKFIVSHKDSNGNPVYRRFKWPRGIRTFVIPGSQSEIIEHFRNSPFCEGSPIQMSKPFFKELDPERDAQLMIEDETSRILAQSEALKLEGKKLADIALICGYDGDSEKLQRHKVLSYAKNSPVVFMDMLKSKSLDHKILLEKCMNRSIIVKKGFMYMFDDVHLGNTQDAVIKKIMDEKEVYAALTERLNAKK